MPKLISDSYILFDTNVTVRIEPLPAARGFSPVPSYTTTTKLPLTTFDATSNSSNLSLDENSTKSNWSGESVKVS